MQQNDIQAIKDHIIKDVQDWDGIEPIVFRRLTENGPNGTMLWTFFKSEAAKEIQFLIDEARLALSQLPPSEQKSLIVEMGLLSKVEADDSEYSPEEYWQVEYTLASDRAKKLERELEKAKAIIKDSEAAGKLAELDTKLDDEKKRANNLLKRVKTLEEQLEHARNMLGIEKEECEGLANANEELCKVNDSLNGQVSVLEEEHRQFRKRIAKLEAKLETIRQVIQL